MTTIMSTQVTSALRRAAVRATLAPSVHNTQPWRFDLRRTELDIVADQSRQLSVLDPTGRQLTISLGCALFNARVALAAGNVAPYIERFPDPANPALAARIQVEHLAGGVVDPISGYDSLLEHRQTNRRRFTDEHVPGEVVDALVTAAEAEGAVLLPIRTEDDRLTVARLSQKADEIQLLDPAYRAELRAWTSADPGRRDGVPASAVPHVDGTAQDDVPIRDFDTSGDGWLPPETHSSRQQCLLLLGTARDDANSWLRAGEALEHVLLEVTRRGFAASPLTQVVEVGWTRAALREALRLNWQPHVLLRVGRAPVTAASRRRRLVEVLTEQL